MSTVEEQTEARDTGALFSPCRRWRYMLWRTWDRNSAPCVFIGLNPSTADETKDDPTIRRCIRFAKGWGYGGLWMMNIFAYRATDPLEMKRQGANAIGPRNNEYLVHACRSAGVTVAAWGNHGTFLDRDRTVRVILSGANIRLHVLGFTLARQPRHPLYIPSITKPVPWLDGQAGR